MKCGSSGVRNYEYTSHLANGINEEGSLSEDGSSESLVDNLNGVPEEIKQDDEELEEGEIREYLDNGKLQANTHDHYNGRNFNEEV